VPSPLFPEIITLSWIRPALNARRGGRIGWSCRTRLEPYPDFRSRFDTVAILAGVNANVYAKLSVALGPKPERAQGKAAIHRP
jgi:hypothetical protein